MSGNEMLSGLIMPDEALKIAAVDKNEAVHVTAAEIQDHLKTARLSVAVSQPYAAFCDTHYHAYHVSGRRPLTVITVIVMHDTEGGTARSTASYFTGSNSGGSAHLAVDDKECFRCLQNDEIPWGAPGANYNGFHIEQCGYASWSRAIWSNTHRRTLRRAAYKAALHCRLFKIPPVFITANDLKNQKPGITTHAECTKAFGGSHTDPGSGWPRVLFMGMVKAYWLTLRGV